MLGNHQGRQELKVWRFGHVEVQEPLCEPRRCSTLLGVLLTAPRRPPLKTAVGRPSCRRTSGNSSPARRPSASAARCCSARQTLAGVPPGRRQLRSFRERDQLPFASNCTDTTVNASTTPNDTTRDDATHDTLPTPTTHTPNVRRERRLGAQLPKPVYLFQRPQTCNRCETNPSR